MAGGGSGDGEIGVIMSGEETEMEQAAARSELAAKYRSGEGDEETPEIDTESGPSAKNNNNNITQGTILEGAFVDPAYTWPPADGMGKNAIELQASLQLMSDGDAGSVFTTDSARERMAPPDRPVPKKGRFGRLLCCRGSTDAVVSAEQMRVYEERKLLARQARKVHMDSKQKHNQQKERAARRAKKYQTVPEGILIYRLDTVTGSLQLVSQTHDKTDEDSLLYECLVETADAFPDKSRRAIVITDTNGTQYTLTACEQRTATAWLEAIHLMAAKIHSGNRGFKMFRVSGL
jgi:hypothetical protein